MPTDLYGGNVVKPFLGRVVLKKLAGAGPVTIGTQIVLPHSSAQPRNPLNTTYLTGINSSGFVSAEVLGKRSPSVTINTVVRTASFFTAAFVNSLILATDSGGDTDVWAILLDDLYAPAVFDGAKCSGLHLRQYAKGGPMSLSLTFNAMYGDSENPGTLFSATTFSSTSPDFGAVTDVSKVSFAGGADLVQMFGMDLMRPQTFVYYDDGTNSPAGISSGVFNGALTIAQSVKHAAAWSGSATVHIGLAGAGVAISASTSLKTQVKEMKGDSRLDVRTYQLYDGGGGVPMTVTAL